MVGQIRFSFIDWKQRRPAGKIMDDIRARTAHIPGIKVEVTAQQGGPPTGKPIQIQLSSFVPEALDAAAVKVAATSPRAEIRDLDNGLPMPGIDWRLEINKAEASKFGIGVGGVGVAVQLVTNGVKITDYRPQTATSRSTSSSAFPRTGGPSTRSTTCVCKRRPAVPIGNFIERVPAHRVGIINRVDGKRVVTVTANLAEGVNVAAVTQAVSAELAKADFGGVVNWKLKGSDEEQQEARAFLMNAFGAALFLIFAVLLAVFNKFSSVGLILSAILLSTIGVFLGRSSWGSRSASS